MSLIILYSSSHLVLNSTHHGNNSVSFIDADDLCHGEERSRYGQACLRRITQHEAIYTLSQVFRRCTSSVRRCICNPATYVRRYWLSGAQAAPSALPQVNATIGS